MPEPPLDLRPPTRDTWRHRPPSARARRGFGVDEAQLRRLPGGQGITWTDGRLVLKPVGYAPEHAWISEVYAAWRAHDEVRVPEPIAPGDPDEDDRWASDGWSAHAFLTGRETDLPREVERVREAGDLFHRQLRDLPRPGFLDQRRDPWAFGDRLAWEDGPAEGDAETLGLIAELREHLRPVQAPSQPIHGDLLPNVLVEDGRPPAVIDWPTYFRPVETANAIAATDALTFRDAPVALLDAWARGPDWPQLLLRSLLYRLGPTGIFAARDRLMGSLVTHVQRVRPVADAVIARL